MGLILIQKSYLVDPDSEKLSLSLSSPVILVGTKFFSTYKQQVVHIQTSIHPADNTISEFDLY